MAFWEGLAPVVWAVAPAVRARAAAAPLASAPEVQLRVWAGKAPLVPVLRVWQLAAAILVGTAARAQAWVTQGPEMPRWVARPRLVPAQCELRPRVTARGAAAAVYPCAGARRARRAELRLLPC
jgi:hypothetical protein